MTKIHLKRFFKFPKEMTRSRMTYSCKSLMVHRYFFHQTSIDRLAETLAVLLNMSLFFSKLTCFPFVFALVASLSVISWHIDHRPYKSLWLCRIMFSFATIAFRYESTFNDRPYARRIEISSMFKRTDSILNEDTIINITEG